MSPGVVIPLGIDATPVQVEVDTLVLLPKTLVL